MHEYSIVYDDDKVITDVPQKTLRALCVRCAYIDEDIRLHQVTDSEVSDLERRKGAIFSH